jgi:hypothetical protein
MAGRSYDYFFLAASPFLAALLITGDWSDTRSTRFGFGFFYCLIADPGGRFCNYDTGRYGVRRPDGWIESIYGFDIAFA